MAQSMQEHEEVVDALADGNADRAAAAIRKHVAVQGEKFHHLVAGLKEVAE